MLQEDDLIPRKAPVPSQVKEMQAKPEVPEVSLMFDSRPKNHLGSSLLVQPEKNVASHPYNSCSNVAASSYCRSELTPPEEILCKHTSPLSNLSEGKKKVSFSPLTKDISDFTTPYSMQTLCYRNDIYDNCTNFSPRPVTLPNTKYSGVDNGIQHCADYGKLSGVCNSIHDCALNPAHKCSQFSHSCERKCLGSKTNAFHHGQIFTNSEAAMKDHDIRLKNIESKIKDAVTHIEFCPVVEALKEHIHCCEKFSESYVTRQELNSALSHFGEKIQSLEKIVSSLLTNPSQNSQCDNLCQIRSCSETNKQGAFRNRSRNDLNQFHCSHSEPNIPNNLHDKFEVCSSQEQVQLCKCKPNADYPVCTVFNNKCSGLCCQNEQNKEISYTPQKNPREHAVSQSISQDTSPRRGERMPKITSRCTEQIEDAHKLKLNKVGQNSCTIESSNKEMQHARRDCENAAQTNSEEIKRNLQNKSCMPESAEERIKCNWTFYRTIIEDVKHLMNKQTDHNSQQDIVERVIDQRCGFQTASQPAEKRNEANWRDILQSPTSQKNLDVSHRMNELATKYNYSSLSGNDDAGVLQSSGESFTTARVNFINGSNSDISVSTMRYLERYQLLSHFQKNGTEDSDQPFTKRVEGQRHHSQSNNGDNYERVLDATAIKEQPKLM